MAELPKGLSQPALRALASMDVSQLEDLQKFTIKQILSLHGFGPSGMKVLKVAMQEAGVEFKK